MKFRALVYEEIPPNRLICFGGIGGVPDRDPHTVYLRLARPEELPDLVSMRHLHEGEIVDVEITGSPVWQVEASEDIWAGTLLTTAEDGKVQIFKDGVQYIGFSTRFAKAGEVISVVKKFGINWNAIPGNGNDGGGGGVDE